MKRMEMERSPILVYSPNIFCVDFRRMDEHMDVIRSPICEEMSNGSANDTKNLVDWPRIIKLIANKSHSVLDGIIQDSANLNFGFVSSPPPLLERIVRFHIMPKRYTLMELAFLPDVSLLKTLAPGLNVTISKSNFSPVLVIDGVEMTAPDIFVSKTFDIHGMSRHFELENISFLSLCQ
ncbi:hypothetical protein CQW23_34438 [Capsicum baccatum]|uniref:FAS1 domain-containing protein n=1 Tax=Capsicum baccatum TaxID=33114 RepID=A0A2G2UVV4_CAPBA|nr:hypothetical protein CQW23_35463 [Capsicum baccatum]PHT25858.1 hypothetical protein CQW23_34523 [Capsicum baccatum]PHT25944.1 hypothetical protein CQW23_34438 [Capsicum baccatum]